MIKNPYIAPLRCQLTLNVYFKYSNVCKTDNWHHFTVSQSTFNGFPTYELFIK